MKASLFKKANVNSGYISSDLGSRAREAMVLFCCGMLRSPAEFYIQFWYFKKEINNLDHV